MMVPELVLTCEHAGNEIPREWLEKISIPHAVLEGHRGWDPGALEVLEELKKVGAKAIFVHQLSRLLIELNRSLSHRKLFSDYCRKLSQRDRQLLIDTVYVPYRDRVELAIGNLYNAGACVWHISVHSFTPVLDNVEREAEIGLLYDPSRACERRFAASWQGLLKDRLDEEYRVRMNYPYKGISDGFVTALRKIFPGDHYMGLELEVNQGLRDNKKQWQEIKSVLRETLSQLLKKGVVE